MKEQVARRVVLVRAIETADAGHTVLSEDDRRYASRSARELAAWQASDSKSAMTQEHFLQQRSEQILKRLAERTTRVVVNLKPVTHWLFERPDRANATPNRITFQLQPQENIELGLMSSLAGPEWGALELHPLELELSVPTGLHRPFLLAGGITPDNVFDAIVATLPWGVDVSSGIESEPGIKDGYKMRKFVEEVRRADCHEAD